MNIKVAAFTVSEKSSNTFTYISIFAQYSKILTGVIACEWGLSKSIFTLCSHASSVHINILKITHTCYGPDII